MAYHVLTCYSMVFLLLQINCFPGTSDALGVRSCPNNIDVELSPCDDAEEVLVSWLHPKADAPANVTGENMSPGSMFRVGETTNVKYSFFDEVSGESVSCEFSVSVRREAEKCYIWGDPHYKTFDGIHHDYQGNCMYTLIMPCDDEAPVQFRVLGEVVHNGPYNTRGSSLREIVLNYRGNSFRIIRNDQILLNEIGVAAPLIDYAGVTIRYSYPNVILSTEFGLFIKYDGNRYAEIQVTSSQSFCGLCGTNDGDPSNDFTKMNGKVTTDLLEFGNSWATLPCVDIHEDIPKCPDRTSEAAVFAQSSCYVIIDPEGPFRECHPYHNGDWEYETCVVDLCMAYPNTEKLCDSVNGFASLCRQVGKLSRNWREDVPDCTASCPARMSYKFCGTVCQPSCVEENGPENGCPLPCEETCECDAGFLLSGRQCVTRSECGCTLPSGVYLMNGQSWVSEDCSAECVCESGQLTCANRTCSPDSSCVFKDSQRICECNEGYIGDGYTCEPNLGVCKIWGDPHHLTFDGRQHNFQGKCDYTLIRLCTDRVDLVEFHLYVDNKPLRPGSYAAMMKSLTLDYRGHEYTIRRAGKVYLDGVKITLPLSAHQGVTIMNEPPNVVLETEFGMMIHHNKKSLADIYLPSPFAGAVCGLCGNYDGIAKNDLMKPDGTRTRNVVNFGNSWGIQTEEECAPQTGTGENPCETNQDVYDDVLQMCEVLRPQNDVFAECKQLIPTEFFYEACKFDLCMALPTSAILCETLENYASLCREKGGNVGMWRQEVPGCEFDCPDGFEYTPCGTSCPPACGYKNGTAHCVPCVEACLCPSGMVLDGEECVDPKDCGCAMDNGIYLSNGETYFSDDCATNCTCVNSELICLDRECSQYANCTAMGGFRMCRCEEGFTGDGYECLVDTLGGRLPSSELLQVVIVDFCPDDIFAVLEGCNPSIRLDWDDPVVRSNGKAVLVSQSAEPGERFGIGATTVTYIYQIEGSPFVRATCAFGVNVTRGPDFRIEDCSCEDPNGNRLWVGEKFLKESCNQQCSCQVGGSDVCSDYTCEGVCELRNGSEVCVCPKGYVLDGNVCHVDNCLNGYTAFRDGCYKFFPEKKRFDDAQDFCVMDGGNLAAITSQEENDFVANLVGPNSVAWIGGKTTNPDAILTFKTVKPYIYTFSGNRPLPEGLSRVEVGVSTDSDARIALSPESFAVDNMWEIVIGGAKNNETSLRTCEGCNPVVVVETPDILSQEGEVCFFIRFIGNGVSFGLVGEKPIFTYIQRSSTPFNMRHIGVATGTGSPVTFKFYQHFTWVTPDGWSYENWGKNDPNSYTLHNSCTLINFPCDGAWGDFCCTLARSFVCEM